MYTHRRVLVCKQCVYKKITRAYLLYLGFVITIYIKFNNFVNWLNLENYISRWRVLYIRHFDPYHSQYVVSRLTFTDRFSPPLTIIENRDCAFLKSHISNMYYRLLRINGTSLWRMQSLHLVFWFLNCFMT